MENQVRSSAWAKRVDRVGTLYQLWCNSFKISAWPASYSSVSGFVCTHVEKNKGSTKSVGNILSALRTYARTNSKSWMSDSEAYQLQRVVKQLQFGDRGVGRAKLPATLQVIAKVISHLDLEEEEDRAFQLTMLLMHNGLLRGGELFSGLKVQDFSWDFRNREVSLSLARSKINRSGPPEIIVYKDYPGLSAYKVLHNWMTEFHLWNFPNKYVLPRITAKPKSKLEVECNFDQPMSRPRWRRALARFFTKAGYSSNQYSGHSFRAGGATDLFSLGVPYPTIKKMGRWKSDAALQYYREANQVASAVAKSFGRQFGLLPNRKRIMKQQVWGRLAKWQH
jgi:hypothetical protein